MLRLPRRGFQRGVQKFSASGQPDGSRSCPQNISPRPSLHLWLVGSFFSVDFEGTSYLGERGIIFGQERTVAVKKFFHCRYKLDEGDGDIFCGRERLP